jgi:hypothetical protein
VAGGSLVLFAVYESTSRVQSRSSDCQLGGAFSPEHHAPVAPTSAVGPGGCPARRAKDPQTDPHATSAGQVPVRQAWSRRGRLAVFGAAEQITHGGVGAWSVPVGGDLDGPTYLGQSEHQPRAERLRRG